MFRNKHFSMLAMALICISMLLFTACGSKTDDTDYSTQRGVSWEGTELTITLGENQSTGCQWTTKSQDDSIIDYSINRSFKLVDKAVSEGEAYGTLSAGFEGKGAGTTQIICTTPCDWDGSGDGYAYIVTVTVNEDGTIESAEGVESDKAAVEETEEPAFTLEDYFNEHPDELEDIKKSVNEDESYNEVVDIDVDVKDNTLSYIYTFKQTFSDEQIESFKPDLQESMEGEVTDQMKEKIGDIEKGYGVKGVKMYMEYRNGDGSKILGTTIE